MVAACRDCARRRSGLTAGLQRRLGRMAGPVRIRRSSSDLPADMRADEAAGKDAEQAVSHALCWAPPPKTASPTRPPARSPISVPPVGLLTPISPGGPPRATGPHTTRPRAATAMILTHAHPLSRCTVDRCCLGRPANYQKPDAATKPRQGATIQKSRSARCDRTRQQQIVSAAVPLSSPPRAAARRRATETSRRATAQRMAQTVVRARDEADAVAARNAAGLRASRKERKSGAPTARKRWSTARLRRVRATNLGRRAGRHPAASGRKKRTRGGVPSFIRPGASAGVGWGGEPGADRLHRDRLRGRAQRRRRRTDRKVRWRSAVIADLATTVTSGASTRPETWIQRRRTVDRVVDPEQSSLFPDEAEDFDLGAACRRLELGRLEPPATMRIAAPGRAEEAEARHDEVLGALQGGAGIALAPPRETRKLGLVNSTV